MALDMANVTANAAARRDVTAFALPQVASLAEGYDYQDAYVAAVTGMTGDTVAGYKMAVNGKPQMAHFGVTEPVWARVLSGQVHRSGVALPRSGFTAVSIEPELLAVLGDGVTGLSGTVTRDQALAAIDRFHPAFELIDMHGLPMPQLALAQATGLNVFNAGCVIGEGSLPPKALDLDALHVTLHLDGALAAEVTGNAPQHPVDAVHWLLNQLVARRQPIRPGMVVLCGTHVPLRTLEPGVSRVATAFSGLGDVAFSLT